MLKQKFDDYQQSVAPFGHVLSKTMNVAHAIVGMASEEGEIREVYDRDTAEDSFSQQLIAELGDAFWFAAWFATSQEKSFGEAMLLVCHTPPIFHNSIRSALSELDIAGSEMLSEMKRVLFYGADDYRWPELNESYLDFLAALHQFTEKMGDLFSFTLDQVLDANFAKLSARYPDKVFSKTSALVRNTAGEDAAVAVNLRSTI